MPLGVATVWGVKYCCEYAYGCPERVAVVCYVHGGEDPCCLDEGAHECLEDMYGSEDGLMLGDGFVCLRCGNYEMVGLAHGPATEPGFPRKQGLPREHWLEVPAEVAPVVFSVEEVFDLDSRGGLLVAGQLVTGKVAAGSVLRTADGQAVKVLGLELTGVGGGRFTLLVERSGVPALAAGAVLTS
ncbi:hypothetical protein GCM10009554_57150 [Kribbella koreensis]|uniref:Uncharacterized protein n=2 Tax=Kribbella TaxID=182639 RepID=A0ABP6WP50_9ACTN